MYLRPQDFELRCAPPRGGTIAASPRGEGVSCIEPNVIQGSTYIRRGPGNLLTCHNIQCSRQLARLQCDGSQTTVCRRGQSRVFRLVSEVVQVRRVSYSPSQKVGLLLDRNFGWGPGLTPTKNSYSLSPGRTLKYEEVHVCMMSTVLGKLGLHFSQKTDVTFWRIALALSL